MRRNYRATLFHPEGDYVTDFRDREAVEEVWEAVANMGSRWIFYPLCFVTTDKTIIDAPAGLEFLKGRRIKTAAAYLARHWAAAAEEICDAINNDLPLGWVYPPA